MKRLLMITLLLGLLLCGCQTREPDPDAVDLSACETIPMEDVEAFPAVNNAPTGANSAPTNYAFTENGIFFLSPKGEDSSTNFLYFYDLGTGDTHPVCARSNCTHDSYDCSAYLPDSEYLHYDGEHLYYFTLMRAEIWRMNTDGTDRKCIMTVSKEESTGLPSVLGAVYSGRKVYFCYYGTLLDPETMELDSNEFLCVGDLDTGELMVLPVRFQRNRGGSSLNLYGLYGDQLLLRHSHAVSNLMTYQKNQETLLLLDVNTCKVTVLGRWGWDTANDDSEMSWELNMEQGILLIREKTGEAVESALADGEQAILLGGNRILVDLAAGKAYRQVGVDDLTHSEELIDSKLVLQRWSEDRSHVESYVLDLATGEESTDLWGTVRMKVYSYKNALPDYYAIFNYSDEATARYGVIRKEDYWAGNHDAVRYLPEWAIFV